MKGVVDVLVREIRWTILVQASLVVGVAVNTAAGRLVPIMLSWIILLTL